MLKRIGILFLALTILVAAVGFSARPAYASSCTQWYTVRHGDNLFRIGMKYGVSWTYLAKINNISNPGKIYTGQVLCVSKAQGAPPPAPPVPPASTPYFTIVSVVRDVSVTIKTFNFPANDQFKALMGPMGSRGVNGIKVGNYSSGTGASKVVTYPIPAALAGDYQIAIRLQSTTGSGFFAFNWFFNNTAGGGTGGGGVPSSYTGFPWFQILAVSRDNTVTIKGYNYPANTNFTVYMGPYGGKGVGGYYVTSFNSGDGGTLKKTFPIPPELYGHSRIAIRTQGNVYFAFNWFWNNTAVDP